MKSIRKRFVAIILLAVMVFSDFQMSTSLAMDNSSAVEETEVAETDAANTVKAENRLNYILVESPYLESPNTQNIVVSWGDGTEQISNMRITVQKEDGSTEEWTCSNQSRYLYVFSKEYVDESDQSTYTVTDIRFEENQQEQCFLLTDLNVEVEFGVNKAYDGIEELQPLDPEDAVETSIVTIDENGETEAQDNIASALTAVSEEMGASAGIRSAEKAGEIVVALDPGHDNRHGGTSGAGLTEQELTLKIAKYAKAELETYNGVKVYMTRTTAACPYPETGTSGACIEKRVQAAAKAGAKIYVSLHLNSGSASANGAEIIIPNSSWKPQLSTQGKELAEKILNELAAVGLNKRPTPIYSKDTTVNEKYPDGSISDYYSVQICAKEAGIPGIIVEHAFLSNANDVNKFLKTEAGLKKLGVADATGIAKYLGLSKGEWIWDSTTWQWKYKESDHYVVKQWKHINGKWYYFNDEGYMQTGWQHVDGKWYYLNSSGEMQTGWIAEGGKWYYLNSSGEMQTGWIAEGGKWYYLNSSGEMQKGWITLSKKQYYLNDSGAMLTGLQLIDGKIYEFANSGEMLPQISRVGWIAINGKWYYLNSFGEMQKGWIAEGGKWYYLNSSGEMQKGWIADGGKWYYLNSSGEMQKGWITDGGKWYYLNSSGEMQKGWIADGGKWYYLNSSGEMQKGWIADGGKWYYLNSSGEMQKGWITLGKKQYYLNDSGAMSTGLQLINGKIYEFANSGELQSYVQKKGWIAINGKWYYLNNSGEMQKGWIADGGKWYYLNSSGEMQKGWIADGGKWYYLNSSGEMQKGWIADGGKWYYLNGSGEMQKGWITLGKETFYLKSSGQMVTDWYYINEKWYFFNSSGVLQVNVKLPSNLYKIVGDTSVTYKEMSRYFKETKKQYPKEALEKGGADTIEKFCQIVIDESEKEGIRAEVVFAQIMLETGWFQFGGDVKIEQFNFAGLGATGNGVSGDKFKDVRTGIRAQVQHLKAYASSEGLVNNCVDTRFKYVKRNSSPFVEWLGQKENPAGLGWAAGRNYGSKILSIIWEMKSK